MICHKLNKHTKLFNNALNGSSSFGKVCRISIIIFFKTKNIFQVKNVK